MTLACQYNSHSVFGGNSLVQGCGTYSYMIDAEPQTKKECKPADPEGVYYSYAHREDALEAIENFCTANDGKTVKQKDKGSYIKDSAFTVSYSDQCQASGEYKITKDLCSKYLKETVDGCDNDSYNYKHGGTHTDTDNCGAFEYHPKGFDTFVCYPKNKERGWTSSAAEYLQVSADVANDAINAFCDRNGDGQAYTLDPDHTPDPREFTQDTCTRAGMASCGYFYTNDGQRVTKDGNIGDYVIRMEAKYYDAPDFGCGTKAKYEIHGDRCKHQLGKVLGNEPKGICTSDPNNLDLGSFLESGGKGCVLWNMWAVKTH